jgi:hypothetical protein
MPDFALLEPQLKLPAEVPVYNSQRRIVGLGIPLFRLRCSAYNERSPFGLSQIKLLALRESNK